MTQKTTSTSISASPQLKFFITLAKAHASVLRRLDGRLGALHGIGFTDFVILYLLSQAPDHKMRRIDLADAVGLTASGVTRLLAPMEKIGLVSREAHEQDARVSFVTLAPGGKRILSESHETADVLSNDLLGLGKVKKLEDAVELFESLGAIK